MPVPVYRCHRDGAVLPYSGLKTWIDEVDPFPTYIATFPLAEQSRPQLEYGAERRKTTRGKVVSQFEYPPWVESGPLVIGHTGNATRRSCPTSPCNVGLSYSEGPGWRICSMAKLVYGL